MKSYFIICHHVQCHPLHWMWPCLEQLVGCLDVLEFDLDIWWKIITIVIHQNQIKTYIYQLPWRHSILFPMGCHLQQIKFYYTRIPGNKWKIKHTLQNLHCVNVPTTLNNRVWWSCWTIFLLFFWMTWSWTPSWHVWYAWLWLSSLLSVVYFVLVWSTYSSNKSP